MKSSVTNEKGRITRSASAGSAWELCTSTSSVTVSLDLSFYLLLSLLHRSVVNINDTKAF